MTISEMLQQSALLTVLGMTIVFVFLWLMIICMNITAKIIHALGLDKDVQTPKNGTSAKPQGAVRPEITAAITGAVTEYQKKEQHHE
jgi:oxaloacetate decarboxylase gamma subunit